MRPGEYRLTARIWTPPRCPPELVITARRRQPTTPRTAWDRWWSMPVSSWPEACFRPQLPVHRLPHQRRLPPQDHDAGGDRVHTPHAAARPPTRLPPHPLLWLPRQSRPAAEAGRVPAGTTHASTGKAGRSGHNRLSGSLSGVDGSLVTAVSAVPRREHAGRGPPRRCLGAPGLPGFVVTGPIQVRQAPPPADPGAPGRSTCVSDPARLASPTPPDGCGKAFGRIVTNRCQSATSTYDRQPACQQCLPTMQRP